MCLPRETLIIDDEEWKLCRAIYSTAVCSVYKAKCKSRRNYVAIKIYNNHHDLRSSTKEAHIHGQLRHKNIIEYISSGVVNERNYIIMEYAPGKTLTSSICYICGMKNEKIKFYFRQLITGIAYLHSQGIAHGDLKCSNLLVDDHKDLKICDFGASDVFRNGQGSQVSSCRGRYGTLYTMAPEVYNKEFHCPSIADIWSCGIIFVYLKTYYRLWKAPDVQYKSYASWMKRKHRNTTPWKELSSHDFRFAMEMIQLKPIDRVKIAELQEHKWFRGDD